MKRALLIGALCSGCSSIWAHQHKGSTNFPPQVVAADVAMFSIGTITGMHAQYVSHNRVQMAAGYGMALGVWLPMWFMPEALK